MSASDPSSTPSDTSSPLPPDLHTLISQNIKTYASLPDSESNLPQSAPSPAPSTLPTYIDHTLLKPDAKVNDIHQLCLEAKAYRFTTVCVHLEWVKLCAKLLGHNDGRTTSPKIACVVDFPDGTGTFEEKAHEAYWAVKDGARELDLVIDWPALQKGDLEKVFEGIKVVKEKGDDCLKQLGGEGKVLVKVILETCMLSREEIVTACTVAKAAGADFVKTSTGFKGKGATVENVRLMKEVVGEEVSVKASGGVRNVDDCLKMIQAGATRIGTSGGVKIVNEVRHGTTGSEEKGGDNPY